MKTRIRQTREGDFSYSSILGCGSGNVSIKATAKGVTHTVMNVVFNNNTSKSIEVSEDSILLKTTNGMKVDYYKVKNLNVYRLRFD